MSLEARLAGVSDEDEARCDAWAENGEELRAAVAWRVFQGKAKVFEAVTGIPEARIRAFVETGELSDQDRKTLEMHQ